MWGTVVEWSRVVKDAPSDVAPPFHSPKTVMSAPPFHSPKTVMSIHHHFILQKQ
jgi:hypothetical protein